VVGTYQQPTLPLTDRAEAVREALNHVMDPHMRASLIDMGMVSAVIVDDQGKATINLVFPCVGCPAFELIQHDTKQAAQSVSGVNSVEIKLDWASNWSKAKMSDSARILAKEHGYVI